MWGDVPVPDSDRDLPLHRGGEVPVNHVDCQGGLNCWIFERNNAEKATIISDIMWRKVK